MNIADFLEARIAEDEEIARRWSPDFSTWHEPGQPMAYGVGEDCRIPADVGDHIVRWQPSRVLAECAAKRAIIEAEFETLQELDYHMGCVCDRETIRAGKCRSTYYDLDDVFRALAVLYSEHPDYRQEWA